MDRTIVYPSSIPLDSDILNSQRSAMVGLGLLMKALYGANTVAIDLACTPTTPASMQVNVGPGGIVSLQTVDGSSFGSLSSDPSPLVKAGINLASTVFTLTAPTTTGQSINYLIEATFTETDNTPVVLPYFNAANPSQPFSGPNNSGTPQNTKRAEIASLQLKAGASANTGTQATPAVDVGWVGLYVIQVNFGQTSITNTSISTYPNAPLLAQFLQQHHKGIPGQAPQISLTQEVQGVLPYANMSPVRQLLNAPLTLFVNTSTGNDGNSGLSASVPFKTIQAAVSAGYQKYDYNGFGLTVSIANGTYTNSGPDVPVISAIGLPPGCLSVAIQGNLASPGSVTLAATNANAAAFTVGFFGSIQGCTITASGTGGRGVGITANNCWVFASAVIVGACGTAQLSSTASATISSNAIGINFTGTTPVTLNCASGGQLSLAGSTVTVTGLTCTSAFATAFQPCSINMVGVTFVGTFTGQRYSATVNGTIWTNGAGINFFPGTVAGVTANGGIYA